MSDEDDFDLDELINSHSGKSSPSDKSLEDYEDDSVESEEKHSSDVDIVDYDISEEIKFDEDINLDDLMPDEDSDFEVELEPSKPKQSGTIEAFADHVLRELEKRGLPPTPLNYEIYFQELLYKESEEFQERVFEILDREGKKRSDERKNEIEETLQHSLKLTQQLLLLTTKVHGNINIMKNIASKREDELNVKSSKDIVRLLKFDLGKLDNILGRQSESMKSIYGRAVESANTLYSHTIFDKNFDVYNRKYFLESLNNEIEKMEFFMHSSTILLLIPHRKLTVKHLTKKVAFAVLKTVSKILMEEFKRSDVVSYYGNSIFGVLLTHSTIRESEDKIGRLTKALKHSSLFIGGKEIELEVKIGLSDLSPNRKVENSLMKALDALKIANRSEAKVYEIVK
jgi:diguanylate cyclase (GGDEF)-like protein